MTEPIHNHKKSDAQVQRDVLAELAWDTRIAPASVGVEVSGGIVTLTGSVPSWAMRIAAVEAAHRVSGVLDIANDIVVHVPGVSVPSDTDLAAAVRQALRWDVFVPDDRIQSTVANGLVTLRGEVDTHAQRDDAARAVRNLAGVRAIENRVTVKQVADPTPVQVRDAIRGALERHAGREAEHLQVDVEGGRVTLHGNVHSWREREAVLGAATGTRGVSSVVDRMRVG